MTDRERIKNLERTLREIEKRALEYAKASDERFDPCEGGTNFRAIAALCANALAGPTKEPKR